MDFVQKRRCISDNKIYHYHLKLGGSVSTRRLTRLPSIPKNVAKFRFTFKEQETSQQLIGIERQNSESSDTQELYLELRLSL
ncbi:hypothetical protein ES319_A06G149100v1 [Gossypium barbadense]|uniref:Uncharacterized protein n=2 Tax=Gossypium TaxID=3633 RepID=A0A5J5VE96_GOSBA|nr:hypothetical protein ES319_A06G149100v1 [Gossypium barbadense]TYH13818.1 hypothetical protein ES288_A06G169600v1 [Gossypium darwinii]